MLRGCGERVFLGAAIVTFFVCGLDVAGGGTTRDDSNGAVIVVHLDHAARGFVDDDNSGTADDLGLERSSRCPPKTESPTATETPRSSNRTCCTRTPSTRSPTRADRGSAGCRWMSSTPPAASPGRREA